MKFRFFVFSFLSLFLFSYQVRAEQIRVEWPAGAAGNYYLPGIGVMDKPSTASASYEVPENKSIRLVGSGFDFSFVIEGGKFRFPFGTPFKATGVRLDQKTHTFTFVTVKVDVQVKNCDLDVSVAGGEKAAPIPGSHDASGTYNLVYGSQALVYSGSRVKFNVDARGIIALQEEVAGVTAHGSTITVTGFPIEVKPAATVTKWNVIRTSLRQLTGNQTLYLLPGRYGIQASGSAFFQVGNTGLIAPDESKDFSEALEFRGEKGPLATIGIPNGEALRDARLQKEKSDLDTRGKAWTASAAAAWKVDFDLAEKMDIYDFPEEQLSYEVDLPATVDLKQLRLLRFTDGAVRSIPFQLANIQKAGGATRATVKFRTDLPRKAHRIFRLVSAFDAKGVENIPSPQATVQPGKSPGEAVLGSGLLLVRMPAGKLTFPGGKPLSQVPAPILGLSRNGGNEMAKGSFSAPDDVKVLSLEGKAVETGPVAATYEVVYQLDGQRSYTARVELRANEPQARIGEFFSGFAPEQKAFLRLDYGKGLLDPDRRYAGSNGGYELYSGEYDRDVSDGQLNYALGLFTPNGLGLMRSTLFYPEAGGDAMMVTIDRPDDWKTAKRALWSSKGANENIRFYSTEGAKFLRAGMSGQQRFWVIGLIPRDQVVLKTLPDTKQGMAGIGPEGRLFNQLGLWSLNAYKDRLVSFPEKLDGAPFSTTETLDWPANRPWEKRTYEDYAQKMMRDSTWFRDTLTYSSNFGGYSDRAMPPYFAEYALSRASWTPEQRERVRLYLLTIADYANSDWNQPHHSMMSGHPNFVMDTKQAIPYAIATFPSYPGAKGWRDSYMTFYDEWLEKFCREDNPQFHTIGGRWTENIACYVGQCFAGILPDHLLLKFYDGTSLGQNPRTLKLIRWVRDSFMSPHDGVRLVPPQGAHSYAFNPDRPFWKIFFKLCEEIGPDDPRLAKEMKWIETNGKEGVKPDVRSGLYTDYGPVLRDDFGGADESYVHMQNLTGINYRWSQAGVLYYGAKGKVWSYNNSETNGDEFDWNALSAFNVRGKGLSPGPTDQLLYDFGFVQFYRQPSAEEGNPYRARAIMLARDEYLVVSDEVSNPKVPGTFNWASVYELPQIYQLKPGAQMVEKPTYDPQPPRAENPNRVGKVHSYSGQGDFLTVVAPAEVKAEAKPFGGVVNGEYVFASQVAQEIKEGPVSFSGTYGYARANQLAIFQGSSIGLNGFGLKREGGDFGVSAEVVGKGIRGRVVGRGGGKVFVMLPVGFDAGKAKVQVDGVGVGPSVVEGALSFGVKIGQGDGVKVFSVSFGN